MEVVLFLLLKCDCLVDSDELLTDNFLQLDLIAIFGFAEGRYQILFGMEDVHDLFLADTQAHIGFGLTLKVLVLHTDVEALLVEIGGRLIIVEVFKLFSDSSILFKASVDVLAPVIVLSINEVITELEQAIFSLLELLLLNSSQFIVILLGNMGFDLTWRGIGGNIIEIHIGLQVTLLHQFD